MRSDVAVRTHLRPLEPFFAQDDVTEISINRPQEVWLARQGHPYMESHAVPELDLNRRETLAQLHQLGLKLSMDDYGTGYSSLAYIKDLSLDELKIDRAFVSGMSDDAQSAAIVHSTIELGHRLGMIVVAEGVETGLELSALKQYGCDYAQGYHVCRPMAAADLMVWLKAEKMKEVKAAAEIVSEA